MSFSSINGYVPVTVSALMYQVMLGVNAQFGTAYTEETFLGTGFYKFFYAIVQKLQENEVKTSEIFAKLQDYFAVTNEMISRPVVTNPGLIDAIKNQLGYVASIKPPILADAGRIYICVDVDDDLPDYTARKLAIAQLIKNSTVGGVVTMGTEVTTIVLSNGQSFDFKFFTPTKIVVKLRLTVTLSDNNQGVISSPDDVKIKLLQNIMVKYALGRNFEPQRYFTIADAPWAEAVKLEYSTDNGSTWNTSVYNALYNELFDVRLENIQLIEN